MTTEHAPPRRSQQEQQRVDAALRAMFDDHLPFNRVIGLRVDHVGANDARICFDMRDELMGNALHQRLHGGVISATLDTCGGLAIACAVAEKFCHETAQELLPRMMRVGTIDLRVDYLRQGVGRNFIAHGEVTRLGGRVGATQMRLTNDEGLLIATGSAAYVVS